MKRASVEMLSENDVIETACEYLSQHGYDVQGRCTTVQTGVDITALHRRTRCILRIEAKGQTSSKKQTKRFGRAFDATQVYTHVATAFFKAAKECSCGDKKIKAGIALPDTRLHRRQIHLIRPATKKLGILVFFVDHQRRVHLLK